MSQTVPTFHVSLGHGLARVSRAGARAPAFIAFGSAHRR